MYKIGEFSRLSQVSVHTLRHYDEVGLLQPAQVDRFTDYRYYSASQLPQLYRILALKDLGFSLEEIARLLHDDLSPEQLRGMLRLKRVEVERQACLELERLARVDARLRILEQEGNMPGYEVVIKKVPAIRVAFARETVSSVGEMPARCGAMFNEVFGWAGSRGLRPAGHCLSIYYNPEYVERDIDVECAVPLVDAGKAPPGTGRVAVRDMEAVETMASVLHHGKLDNILEAYAAVARWIGENGYRVCGPCRELYLTPPQCEDPVTEIQYPVERA